MAYTKINWQDLPDTTTPINSTNLNHMDDGIYEANLKVDKSYLTARLTSNYTIQQTNTNENVQPFELYNSVGSKFSVDSNGYIKIGAGVSKVLVSYKAAIENGSTQSRTFTYLIHKSGNTTNVITQENVDWYANSKREFNVASPLVLSVLPLFILRSMRRSLSIFSSALIKIL